MVAINEQCHKIRAPSPPGERLCSVPVMQSLLGRTLKRSFACISATSYDLVISHPHQSNDRN